MDYETARNLPQIDTDDPEALEKVQARVEVYREEYERRKAINAHYRKHGTLDGCQQTTPGEADRLLTNMDLSCNGNKIPFGKKSMDNIGGSIRSFKKRIAAIEQMRANPPQGWKFQGGEVDFNISISTMLIVFDEWPDYETILKVKSLGFNLRPYHNKKGVWQRPINPRTIDATKALLPPVE